LLCGKYAFDDFDVDEWHDRSPFVVDGAQQSNFD
jgi:hypothetical protein